MGLSCARLLRRAVAGIGCAAACSLVVPCEARAQNVDARAPERTFVREVDFAVTLSLTAFVGAAEVKQAELAPVGCRWCDRNVLDESVRTALRAGTLRKSVDELSGVAAFGVIPAFSIGGLVLSANTQGDRKHGSENMLMLAQATLFATAIGEVTKLLAARERPMVREPSSEGILEPSERNLSFFSGHTTIAFSLASSMGTIASLRGYKAEPLFWGVGMGLAAMVAYMRVAADKHYFTDVLFGACIGTVAGILVPRILHPSIEGTATSREKLSQASVQGQLPLQTVAASYGGSF